MRVVKLIATNVKRLKAVDITPDKYLVRVTGGNGEGKTSVLDTLMFGFMGTKSVPSFPVRRGAGKALIDIDMGDFKIIRRMTEGSPKRAGYVTIEGKDGKVWKDPDEALRSFIGAVSFNPLAFIRMETGKQFDTIQAISLAGVDLAALDADAAAAYSQRTDKKKERDALTVRRDAILVPEGLPTEKYDPAALVKELREASEYNTEIERDRRRRSDLEGHQSNLARDIEEQRAEVAELRRRADELEAEADTWMEKHKENAEEIAALAPLAEPRDTADLAERITNANKINAAIDRKAQRDQLDTEIAEKQAEWEKLDEAVKVTARQKEEALAQAKYPVAGLGIDTEKREVTLNGLPFEQASHAEKMKTAMAIGMALNPQIRVMVIEDGSLLDAKSIDLIYAMAHENDYQVWIEQVDTTGKVGIYIEDGEVKAVNEEAPPKPQRAARARKKIPASA